VSGNHTKACPYMCLCVCVFSSIFDTRYSIFDIRFDNNNNKKKRHNFDETLSHALYARVCVVDRIIHISSSGANGVFFFDKEIPLLSSAPCSNCSIFSLSS